MSSLTYNEHIKSLVKHPEHRIFLGVNEFFSQTLLYLTADCVYLCDLPLSNHPKAANLIFIETAMLDSSHILKLWSQISSVPISYIGLGQVAQLLPL